MENPTSPLGPLADCPPLEAPDSGLLRHAQKMESLSQVTGSIAHDFNNQLQIMLGYMDIVRKGLEKPELDRNRLMRSTLRAREAIIKSADLTQQMLVFARRQPLKACDLDLNELLETMRDRLDLTLEPPHQLRLSLTDGLWRAHLDPQQMRSAVLKLLINAAEALADRPGGEVHVRTDNLRLDEPSQELGLAAGRYLRLTMSDTGRGIPAAVLGQVMDPFFTTKQDVRGAGMGLSMVYGFVHQSGGAIRLLSEEGLGTTVELCFPAWLGNDGAAIRQAAANTQFD